MTKGDDDNTEALPLTTLDQHGVDRLLARLVDYHGAAGRPNIPAQLTLSIRDRRPPHAKRPVSMHARVSFPSRGVLKI